MISKSNNEELCNILYDFTVIKLRIGENLVFGENNSEE